MPLRWCHRRIALKQDYFEDGLRFLQDLIVPEPHNPKADALQKKRSCRILICLKRMMPPVEFHDQLGFLADEVSDIWPNGNLAPEFPSIQAAVSQMIPEQLLRIGGIATKVSGKGRFLQTALSAA